MSFARLREEQTRGRLYCVRFSLYFSLYFLMVETYECIAIRNPTIKFRFRILHLPGINVPPPHLRPAYFCALRPTYTKPLTGVFPSLVSSGKSRPFCSPLSVLPVWPLPGLPASRERRLASLPTPCPSNLLQNRSSPMCHLDEPPSTKDGSQGLLGAMLTCPSLK